MRKTWNTRQVRRILKRWSYLDYHLSGGLTDNELRMAQQLYFRLSYLTVDQRRLLYHCFYFPAVHYHDRLNRVAHDYHYSYQHLTYAIHKLELELGQFATALSRSTSRIMEIQFQRMTDDFGSVFQIIEPKINQYSRIRRLNRVSAEDFPPHLKWHLKKCKNVLNHWYNDEHRLKKPAAPLEIAEVRRLEVRLSYLLPENSRILQKYFYCPLRQRRQIRSERIVRQNGINLETLLLHRTRAIRQLQSFQPLPKINLTDDERWQLKNDQQDLASIVHASFLHLN